MEIISLTRKNEVVIETVQVAKGFFERVLGLMGRSSFPSGRALYFSQCRSVHTLFMKFPLDIIFISRDWTVSKQLFRVKPWRIVWGGKRTAGVLEMESGWFPKNALRVGDKVRLCKKYS